MNFSYSAPKKITLVSLKVCISCGIFSFVTNLLLQIAPGKWEVAQQRPIYYKIIKGLVRFCLIFLTVLFEVIPMTA